MQHPKSPDNNLKVLSIYKQKWLLDGNKDVCYEYRRWELSTIDI